MARQNNRLGILLSFAGYTAWVISDVFVKLAGESLPILEILAIDLCASVSFMFMAGLASGGLRRFATGHRAFHLLRALFVAGATFGSVAGIVYLTLPDFYTIVFTSPLILTGLGSVFLKEKVSLKMWGAIIFGFLGILVAVRFAGSGGHPSLSLGGIAFTCLAAFSLAFTMLMVRTAPDENIHALSFWPQLLSCIFVALAVLAMGHIRLDTAGIVFALLSGITGAAGVLLTNASLQVAPVAVVSPYHYTQIIGGAVAGYLIWGHVPAWSVVVGAVMVTVSGLYILHAESRKKGKPLPFNTANFPV